MDFVGAIFSGFIGSSASATILGALLWERNKRIESNVQKQLTEFIKRFESTLAWKQQVLSQLLGPMIMQLDRTKLAFDRWDKKSLYLEAKVVREGNLVVRDLLLANGHLVSPALMADASTLIQHYDAWLEEFDSIRNKEKPGEEHSFVFAGPKGYPFPHEAEKHFKQEFRRLQQELYGT